MSQVEYIVYRITSPCGKSYIGRTKNYTKRLNDHKNGNKCALLQAAIAEFGWDNMQHQLLKFGLNLDEANMWEKHYIQHFNSIAPNGLNLQTGGINCSHSDISKEKMSKKLKGRRSWNKGKKLSPEHYENAKKSFFKKGIPLPKEVIEKRSSKLRGKPRDKEMMERLRQHSIGRKFSPETLQRMSEGQKRRQAKLRGELS